MTTMQIMSSGPANIVSDYEPDPESLLSHGDSMFLDFVSKK